MKTALYVFTLAVVSAVIGVVFNALFAEGAALSGAVVNQLVHTVLAIVLGLFLVLRLAHAMYQYSVCKAAICNFYAAAATLAITASFVTEALTISAGAEHEKKGMSNFRTELARTLGFAARCVSHAIKGEPVAKDAHLMTVEDMLIISSAARPTPALYAVKLATKLLAAQHEAGRLNAALCAQASVSVSQMVSAYNTIAASKMPVPASLGEFATAWLFGFCFTVPVVISALTFTTPWVSPCASLLVSAFFFALNEMSVQLEDVSAVFTHDVSLAEAEAQLMADLHLFAAESSPIEGML
ncbi:hypothetical protein T492DRAFT_1093492 [Pavlovales sp. CCMP2436]|nr:hypothetical protein T492DRAFT_1093492 [Pavlovales sp. CCMP2436]